MGNRKISINATNKYISHKLSTTETKIEAINRFKKIAILGLPWWLSGKESGYQCRRHGFGP